MTTDDMELVREYAFKGHGTVAFRAHKGLAAGGIFGCQMLKR